MVVGGLGYGPPGQLRPCCEWQLVDRRLLQSPDCSLSPDFSTSVVTADIIVMDFEYGETTAVRNAEFLMTTKHDVTN